MEQDRYLPRNEQVYKNPNWAERKKELKTTRNQRTTKSIKNIRSIDTPADPLFNCTPLPTQTPPSTPRPPPAGRPSTATSLATRYCLGHSDQVQGQRERTLLLRQGCQQLHQDAEQAGERAVPHHAGGNPHRQSCMIQSPSSRINSPHFQFADLIWNQNLPPPNHPPRTFRRSCAHSARHPERKAVTERWGCGLRGYGAGNWQWLR